MKPFYARVINSYIVFLSLILSFKAKYKVEGASLPRCPDAVPDGGNDNININPLGNSCASVYYSSDLRVIGGVLITYYIDVNDSNTCAASFEQSVNLSPVKSGSGSCKAYFIEDGVACLSNCDDSYDCYVSMASQTLDFESCSAAAGVEVDDEEETSTSSTQLFNSRCYKYSYTKGPYREDPPEEVTCNDSTSRCYAEEVIVSDFTLSSGGCTPFDNYCNEMEGSRNRETISCAECSSKDLCNRIISYNSNFSAAHIVSTTLSSSSLFSLIGIVSVLSLLALLL